MIGFRCKAAQQKRFHPSEVWFLGFRVQGGILIPSMKPLKQPNCNCAYRGVIIMGIMEKHNGAV